MALIEIDGSEGEGGGQMLRSSLTLSILTGRPFKISNIRAKRPKPGLAPQHLKAIQAAAEICNASTSGAKLRSSQIEFTPGKCTAGNYQFEVNTAGAMALVLQTVSLPLSFADGISTITFKGGTHVSHSPCYDYIADIWSKTLNQLGTRIELNIKKAGYYPPGGGIFKAKIYPIQQLKHFKAITRDSLAEIQVKCILSNLPQHIAEREKKILQSLLRVKVDMPIDFSICNYPALSPGNVLLLKARFGKLWMGFSAMGEKGKSAGKVASELSKSFINFLQHDLPVEEYLADQLLLPLAIAKANSRFRSPISLHLLTNAQIIMRFLDVNIDISGAEKTNGEINIVVESV